MKSFLQHEYIAFNFPLPHEGIFKDNGTTLEHCNTAKRTLEQIMNPSLQEAGQLAKRDRRSTVLNDSS